VADHDEPRYERVASTLWRQAPTGALVLPEGRDAPLLISPPGDLVWQLLVEPATESELVELLVEHYTADPATIRLDLHTLLTELVTLGALRQT
jgi:hypothetical protein